MDIDTQQKPGAQVRIQFSTRDNTLNLPQLTPILVPTSVRRAGLSELVNSLRTPEPRVPLQFLINGQFLRTTIDEFLTAHGISAETTLPVEVVRALLPPTYVSSFEHDDWVSSVDVLPSVSDARIMSGSFDGLIRAWDATQGALLASSESGGHASSIKAVRCISENKLVSGGCDRTVRVWKYNEEEKTIRQTLELYGHRSGVESVDVNTASSRILSASSDHKVGLWSSSASSSPEAPASLLPSASTAGNKRRKRSKSDLSHAPQRGPISLMEGHTDVASAAVFKLQDATVAYSSSWDHTVRTWDLTTSKQVDSKSTMHPLLCLMELRGLSLLAAGSSARHITLIDPRASASKISAMTLRGHTNAVVSLAQDPSSDYSLVSGSHDGSCRVWDIRSVRPSTNGQEGGQTGESLYVFHRESVGQAKKSPEGGKGVKVFDVRWDKDLGILSAGEDKRVQINKPGVIQAPS
ncbi:uncharacterized protein PV09_09137 [Verruconis gallopava]|uniref:Ribosome biogenesis protein YTM1 n=1 Tax=Verruconis gallopava TaxID=253628 RepID=A0A0D1ZYM1_9PEZI|nr:uncharacterized protein PV09_09137 [Verruconis gallopava]KIV99184.1 hypothetical protein PV09_09137 [Verruconis gallopava]